MQRQTQVSEVICYAHVENKQSIASQLYFLTFLSVKILINSYTVNINAVILHKINKFKFACV